MAVHRANPSRLHRWNEDLEDLMLHKFLPLWTQDKLQMLALLVTLLFFTAFYLGFVL